VPTFGNRPEDVLQDSRGNVLSGVALKIYASESDANAQTALLASVVSNSGGSWPVEIADLEEAWVRTPSGTVYPVSSDSPRLSLSLADADSRYVHPIGSGTARFVERARSGESLTITCLGDSILEGQTVTNPATDGAMILLAANLSTRFGITVTQTNHAVSGYTAARLQIDGVLAAAIAEKADLYIVSAMDKNDLGSDLASNYAPGYPLAASNAGVERMIRAIRTEVPKADIIVMSTNPYIPASSSNTAQQAKDKAARRVAALYGCEWVDCYAAFTALGDWSSKMNDTTHPNTAGHRLIADTLLAHLDSSFKVTSQPGAVAPYGLYAPELVDSTKGDHGYVTCPIPGTAGIGVTYVTGGTGWASEVTTTVGDYIEAVAVATEIQIQLSTAAADNAVVDIAIDGATVATNVNLSTQGKQGNYWVPYAVGMTAASHTLRLTLKSGTLRTYATAALLALPAGTQIPTATSVSINVLADVASTTTTPTDGSFATLIDQNVALPAGWKSAIMRIDAQCRPRVIGTTTTTRQFNAQLLIVSTTVDSPIVDVQPVPGASVDYYPGEQRMSYVGAITATTQVRVRIRLLSTDKTNCNTVAHKAVATLIRTS
jgi:lysophospholipase L1-like esterase